ncbi:uncharacterized protein LOC135082274 [Ostrinia nubilalis]|uniref:uncharacterized protein LOC135082274 n=1 Tax=Ostrinia nubilalis TaxID=29057 RepID=UPI0030822140
MSTKEDELQPLGAKHRYHNQLVKEAIENNYTDVNTGNNDVNILLQIDISSQNRNVDYILDILKSDDLLHVSRAIKKGTWLITDNNYANIIDPEYLKCHLFPNMSAKAQNKLLKSIRNNLKDEKRAEKFYSVEDNVEAALKWLPSCSIPFIEIEVTKHYKNIKKPRLFKRLCERSINILNLCPKGDLSKEKIDAVKFVQKKDVTTFLNAIEQMKPYETLKLNKKTTKLLMTQCPNNIIENFHKYQAYLDKETFSKYLKQDNIKDFIFKQASMAHSFESSFGLRFEWLQHFIQRMPQEERFDFVNKVFIKQIHKSQGSNFLPDSETAHAKILFDLFHNRNYEWYKFAPFEIAFDEFRRRPSCAEDKYDFLKVLIKCCGSNQSHLQSILKYYRDKHINDSYDSKTNFVDEILSETNICQYNYETWSILDDLFKSMGVYSQSDDDSIKYIETIIVRKLIKNEPIPELIERKFVYNNTLEKFSIKLKQDEQFRIFNFIFNHVFQKADDLNKIENEEQFSLIAELLKNVLEILKAWRKSMDDYPFVVQKIKDLIKIKMEHSWDYDLSPLYNVHKPWKRLMFEESLILEPSEKVCINSLKHDPRLLARYEDKVDNLLNDSKLYMKKFLSKIRIYWPESVAKKYVNKHLLHLELPTNHNVVVRNLCTLMPQTDILEMINKYVPKDAKINWDEEDGLMLSIRRHIAINMHFARPQPPANVILEYAKGDYLQYAVPSVLAIFYNMKPLLFPQQVQKLFNSPVSLQKLGIRLAITKMHNGDLIKEFHNLWSNTKNSTIRSVIFQLTLKLLCRQKDDRTVQELWNLLEMFIDNLTYKEDKVIYSLMYKTESIPILIKPKFIERNYIFFESYLAQPDTNVDEFERYFMEERLILYAEDVMEKINEDFIVRVLKKLIDLKFFCKSPDAKRPRHHYINPCNGIISLLSVYLLKAKDEQDQERKYKSMLMPILQRALGKLKEEYQWKENIKALLDYLRSNLEKFALNSNVVSPLKLFSDINDELQRSLKVSEHYTLLTKWKLTVEYLKNLEPTVSEDDNQTVKNTLNTDGLARKCLEMLKEDVEKYFPRIYIIFHKAFFETLQELCNNEEQIKIYKNMLTDIDFVPGYLTIIKISHNFVDCERDGQWDEILHLLQEHPSTEVKMHFNFYFKQMKDYYC